MPYSSAYKITSVQSQSGQTWNVYIEDRTLDSDDITELDPGPVMVDIQYRTVGFYGGTPHWNLASSTCTIEFMDDATGLLSDIIDADDERYRIRVEGNSTDEWYGYVLPDSYGYNLYTSGVGRLRATDRLEDLANLPYSQGGGVLYTGRETLITIASRCLASTGMDIGISTHMNWFPHFGANELTTSDDPMANLLIDQENLMDKDGNPYSRFTILDQICRRFQLQLYQNNSRWYLVHRKRSVYDSSGNVYKLYQYDSTGVAEGTPTVEVAADFELGLDGTSENQLAGSATVTGTIPYGAVSSVYYHGNPFAGLLKNLSFEDSLRDTIAGTPLIQNAPGYPIGTTSIITDGYSGGPTSFPIGTRFTIAGIDTEFTTTSATTITGANTATIEFSPPLTAAISDNDALTFHEDHAGWERYDTTHSNNNAHGEGLTEDDARALGLAVEFEAAASYTIWVRQESVGIIAGTTGLRIKTGWSIKVPNLDDVETEFYHSFKLYITGTSTTWYFRWSDSTWQTSDPGVNEVPLWRGGSGWPTGAYDVLPIVTDELNDGSNDIEGTMTIEFYEARVHDGGGSDPGLTIYYVDNVQEPVLLLSDYSVSNEATQTTITYTDNVNRSQPERPIFVMGDGPTTGHISRLTAYDSTGAVQDLTGDWSYLPTPAASEYSLDQFWTSQYLKTFGNSCKRIRTQIISNATSTTLKPHMMPLIAEPDAATTYGYTWMDLSYKPVSHDKILTGTYVQFQETIIADQICVVDIKPNTALLAGIPLDNGLVCDSTVAFTPIVAPTFLWWGAFEESASPNPVNGIYKSVIPFDTSIVPWETDTDNDVTDKLIVNTGGSSASDAILHLRVDRRAGYVFATGYTGHEVKRYDLDGGNAEIPSITAWGLSLDRTNRNVCIYNGSTAFVEYDYDFNSIRTLRTVSASLEGAPAYDQSGTYMFFATVNDGGTSDYIKRITLSGLSVTTIEDLTSLTMSSLDTAEMKIDAGAGYGFFLTTEASRQILRFDYPDGGGGLTVVVAGAGRGLALDRLNQKVIYSDSVGDFWQCDYDGANDEKVYDYSSVLEVYSMDTGL